MMTWHDLPEVLRFLVVHRMCVCRYVTHVSQKQSHLVIFFGMNPLFTCDEVTLHCHDKTYHSIGDMKDVDPKILQGVLNFIDTNTQISDKIEVPEDVKHDIGMMGTDTSSTDVKDEMDNEL